MSLEAGRPTIDLSNHWVEAEEHIDFKSTDTPKVDDSRISDDGRFVLLSGYVNGCWIWDNHTGELLVGPPQKVRSCALAAGANKAVLTPQNIIIDLPSRTVSKAPPGQFKDISDDGARVIMEEGDSIFLVDLSRGVKLNRLAPRHSFVEFTGKNGNRLNDPPNHLRVGAELYTNEENPRLVAKDLGEVNGIVFAQSPNLKTVVQYHHNQGIVQVLQGETGAKLYSYRVAPTSFSQDDFIKIVISPDSRHLITFDETSISSTTVEIRDLATGKLTFRRNISGIYSDVSGFSPDNQEVLLHATDTEGKRFFVDMATGRINDKVMYPDRNVGEIAISKDSGLMARRTKGKLEIRARYGVCPTNSYALTAPVQRW